MIDDSEDPTLDALAYLTSCLDREDDLHEQIFLEHTADRVSAARFAIGLANVAQLLSLQLGDATGRGEELIYQQLSLLLHRAHEHD